MMTEMSSPKMPSPKMPANVRDVVGRFSPQAQNTFHQIRDLVFLVAGQTDGVGRIDETLKWGEPSYLTSASKSGTTIRVCSPKNAPDKIGIYVNCKTSLVDTYRELYGDELTLVGTRAIMLQTNQALPVEPIKHAIALALTYHKSKK